MHRIYKQNLIFPIILIIGNEGLEIESETWIGPWCSRHALVVKDKAIITDEAHEQINNQNTIAIKTIAEYNFFSGQEYAYLKILQYLQLNELK